MGYMTVVRRILSHSSICEHEVLVIVEWSGVFKIGNVSVGCHFATTTKGQGADKYRRANPIPLMDHPGTPVVLPMRYVVSVVAEL